MQNRRHFLSTTALATAALPITAEAALPMPAADWKIAQGRIKQSIVHWCFKPHSVEEVAKAGVAMGVKSVELVGPENWPMLKQLGLTCAIAGSHGFAKGFAHQEEHAECLEKLRASIDASAAFGCPSVITFSGFRRGISTEEGQKNMIEGLKKIAGYAEDKKVTVCLEMLNSKVTEEMKGHPDYFCDKVEMAVEACKAVGSPFVKMLFDIYHVQIMQGDVITRLQKNIDYIGHVHTAGNPGRCEIDDQQEINYPAIIRALIATGYQGYLGQEFIPKGADKLAALRQGVQICDV
jgi:hydroxypyruvate isomerase